MNTIMDIEQIMKILPHRHPFLLVDKVIEFDRNKSIKGIKNVTINEPFFVGHFPPSPVMPGVLILEALAQVAGILAIGSSDDPKMHNSLVYFAGVDNARFRRIVVPGDTLTLSAKLIVVKREIYKFTSEAYVENDLACSAEFLAAKREIKSDK